MSAASHLARRAAQKERVRILYRRALKDTLNWAVHRHLFYQDASELRERFEANKNVENLEAIDRLIADGEASHNKWRHPDPYIGVCIIPPKPPKPPKPHRTAPPRQIRYYLSIEPPVFVPWAPGGSKFTRNPTPPAGIEIIYNYGLEDHIE